MHHSWALRIVNNNNNKNIAKQFIAKAICRTSQYDYNTYYIDTMRVEQVIMTPCHVR